jgi:SAM-dependent methyltransferase
MSGGTQGVNALEEQLRAGALDLCDLVLNPGRFPEWRAVADSTPLDALLVAEPGIGERNAARVIRTGQVRPDGTLGMLDDEQRTWLGEMVLFWRRQMMEPSREISPNDPMYKKLSSADTYFTTGNTSVRRIKIAMLEARVSELTSILDFGCAYGRVLRTLKVAFPGAKLTACDTNRDAVDFCAEAFDATPVYSAGESKDVDFGGPFDLIWAGSVFSHLSAARWTDFLSTFGSLLVPRGLLVFTTQGRRVATALRRREFSWGISDEMTENLVSGFDDHGFGYEDFPAGDRGLALAKPAWTCAELDRHAELRLLSLRERGWGHQDVVSCMRADEQELALTA